MTAPHPEGDHERVEARLSALRHLLASLRAGNAADLAPAIRAFDELEAGLEAHMKWEEESLFPALARLQPSFANTLERGLLADHDDLRRLKAFAGKSLRRPAGRAESLARAADALDQLSERLRRHHIRELIFLQALESGSPAP